MRFVILAFSECLTRDGERNPGLVDTTLSPGGPLGPSNCVFPGSIKCNIYMRHRSVSSPEAMPRVRKMKTPFSSFFSRRGRGGSSRWCHVSCSYCRRSWRLSFLCYPKPSCCLTYGCFEILFLFLSLSHFITSSLRVCLPVLGVQFFF